MAVDKERGAGLKPGLHGLSFAGIEPDQDEALPCRTPTFGIVADAVQEGFLELEDVFDVHAGDERLGCGDAGVGENDVFEVVGAGRHDGSALVYFLGIEEVKD